MCGKIAVRAIGAGVARFLHTEEVTGSIPVSPTTQPALALQAVDTEIDAQANKGNPPGNSNPFKPGG